MFLKFELSLLSRSDLQSRGALQPLPVMEELQEMGESEIVEMLDMETDSGRNEFPHSHSSM